MKSNKQQHASLPPRGRSSRGPENENNQTSLAGPQVAPSRAAMEEESIERPSCGTNDHGLPSTALFGPATGAENDERVSVEELKVKMAEALAQKQSQQASSSGTPELVTRSPQSSGNIVQRRLAEGTTSSNESLIGTTISTDSAKTVKGSPNVTTSTIRTPSYPFPRMALRLDRGNSHRSAPSHRPFTLLSPTNAPTQAKESTPPTADDLPSSETSTPAPEKAGDDPNFPTPDFYDMILMLSAEPGIEAWWTNVTQILAEAYGAERASLAVPGDMTDLENVPWGQRATFNIYGTDSFGSSTRNSAVVSEPDIGLPGRSGEEVQSPVESNKTSARPVLETRHSISGVRPDTGSKGPRQRPHGPVRAVSNISIHDFESLSRSVSPKIPKQPLQTQPSFASESNSSEARRLMASLECAASVLRAVVHRTLQALEVEADPLLIRTGVSAIFGKRKPLVLTRAYTNYTTTDVNSLNNTVKEKGKDTASVDIRSSLSAQVLKSARSYDEYEQPAPSPWSQSPAPSPAARPDPTESPFFAQTASIDETAFEQNPPLYDYAATANQSLAAIGTDTSKTLIHIPLIQPVPSRGILSSNLRFPIAILSFLSPINPYPRNLRHSLTHLLPHLASSYSLAQQYSALLDRTRGSFQGRLSLGLGLGGTFSDENSELELVAELSGQVAQGTGRESRSSVHSSAHSTSERYSTIQEGAALSAPATPHYEQFGMSPGLLPTLGISGAEVVDSYFPAKRQKAGPSQPPTTPSGLSISEESPESTRSSKQKTLSSSRGPAKKVTISRRQKEPSTPTSLKPGGTSTNESGDVSQAHGAERQEHGWPRQLSTTSNHTVKDHSERPLPELISTLMLNSVPLQLFLAKPGTGELVWTNSKFDAFRTQGDSRVRDPWQNVHPSDLEGLSKGWDHTLKTGNQFTQHVRVKRFNADNDYRWFIFRANPLLSQNGQLLYWIGSFLDVHETHMAELRAADEKETFVRDAKYRALANSIPQILFEAIEQEGIVSANEQWHIFSGQSLEDALNLGFAKHVHRDDLQKCGLISPDESKKMSMPLASGDSNADSSEFSNTTVQPGELTASGYSKSRNASTTASLESLVKEGVIRVEQDENGRVSYTTELRLRSKGGEFRWFLVRLVKVESDLLSRGRASWYGTCTDINDRKALERELNRVNKKMFQEMESKTKFFANMSHEIRTPLNGILGSIPWLVESSLDHDQRRTLDTIQNSSNNLRELVDNILDVTKVEAGKMSLVFKYFHVRTLLEEIIDTVASRAIDKGLELNYTVDLNVPSHVKGDPFRLRQILINLIGNAVKFTDQGEVYTHCSLREQPAPHEGDPNMFFLAFDVIDTGRGFDQVGFQRLFKQFGQIDGSSSHDAGSGLGLFLSKQLVEMHGGQLSATSEVDQGATFSFYIRVEMAPPEDDINSPPPTRSMKKRSSTSDSGSPRSRSDNKTPTLSMTRGGIRSPGLFKFGSSPEIQSSALASSGSSDPSIRSISGTQTDRSSVSSLLPTPESSISGQAVPTTSERQALSEQAMHSTPLIKRSRSDNESVVISSEKKHPTTYSVVVICPAQYARAAIKQHVEQVVPHQIVVNVTTIEHIGAFLELMHGPASPTFTHIILDLPASADVMLFMRQMSNFTGTVIPTLVIITDHYQKRDILDDYTAFTNTGRRAFLVHKPVKPSVFALIFDPAQLRNLSKDRTRDLAQSVTETFKNVSERVKKAIGGKSFRVLLVEDSDVNRMVILRYLKKIEVTSDTATNGLECTEMVLSKPHGYYSLIICDIQMPVKNGYEACADIRRWEASNHLAPMPVMALTANAMPEEKAAAANAGFTNYLTKPVDFNTLGTMMVALLDPKMPHVYLRDRPTGS